MHEQFGLFIDIYLLLDSVLLEVHNVLFHFVEPLWFEVEITLRNCALRLVKFELPDLLFGIWLFVVPKFSIAEYTIHKTALLGFLFDSQTFIYHFFDGSRQVFGFQPRAYDRVGVLYLSNIHRGASSIDFDDIENPLLAEIIHHILHASDTLLNHGRTWDGDLNYSGGMSLNPLEDFTIPLLFYEFEGISFVIPHCFFTEFRNEESVFVFWGLFRFLRQVFFNFLKESVGICDQRCCFNLKYLLHFLDIGQEIFVSEETNRASKVDFLAFVFQLEGFTIDETFDILDNFLFLIRVSFIYLSFVFQEKFVVLSEEFL